MLLNKSIEHIVLLPTVAFGLVAECEVVNDLVLSNVYALESVLTAWASAIVELLEISINYPGTCSDVWFTHMSGFFVLFCLRGAWLLRALELDDSSPTYSTYELG